MDLNLSVKYVCELVDYQAGKTVGEIMKTFEIVGSKDTTLKKLTKEKIYECYRDLRDLLIAGGRGLEQKIWEFKSKRKE